MSTGKWVGNLRSSITPPSWRILSPRVGYRRGDSSGESPFKILVTWDAITGFMRMDAPLCGPSPTFNSWRCPAPETRPDAAGAGGGRWGWEGLWGRGTIYSPFPQVGE